MPPPYADGKAGFSGIRKNILMRRNLLDEDS